MSSDELSNRRKALEEAFFSQRDRELLEKLRAQHNREEEKKILAEMTGTQDSDALDRILDAGIRPETYVAMTFVPMISVAWADGVLDINERKAILEAAEKQGIDKNGAGYKLLEEWLEQDPGRKTLDAWRAYIAAFSSGLPANERESMKQQVLHLARSVAQAAGGVFGVGAVSAHEKKVLGELAAAFD